MMMPLCHFYHEIYQHLDRFHCFQRKEEDEEKKIQLNDRSKSKLNDLKERKRTKKKRWQ